MNLEYLKSKLTEITISVSSGETNDALWLLGKCIGYIDHELSTQSDIHSEKVEFSAEYQTTNQPLVLKEHNEYKISELLALNPIQEKIVEILIKNKLRRKETADELGIAERTLYRKLDVLKSNYQKSLIP